MGVLKIIHTYPKLSTCQINDATECQVEVELTGTKYRTVLALPPKNLNIEDAKGRTYRDLHSRIMPEQLKRLAITIELEHAPAKSQGTKEKLIFSRYLCFAISSSGFCFELICKPISSSSVLFTLNALLWAVADFTNLLCTLHTIYPVVAPNVINRVFPAYKHTLTSSSKSIICLINC